LATESGQPQGALSAVSFSADGRLLASCGLDGAVHLWDMDRLRMLDEPLRAPSGPLYSCALGPSGRLLASGSDGMILIWDLTAHPGLHKLWQPLSVRALTTTPDGKAAVVADGDGSVRLVDLARSSHGTPSLPQPAHSRAVNGLATSLDGSLLASGGSDGSVGIFALPSLVRRRTFWTTDHGAVMTVALGPQGDTVAAGFADGNLAIYSLTSGLRLHLLATKQQSLTALAFDPSGRILWSGGLDGSIRSQSPLSGERRCLTGPRALHKDSVTSLAVSPDRRVLASGGRDRAILLSRWDDQSGCLQATEPALMEASAGVTQLAFGPLGQLLASGSDDGSVQLWDPVEKKPIGVPLMGPRRAITGLGFAGDGLLLAGDGETLWTWDVAAARWLDTACARAGHNLSLTDWQTGLGDDPYCRVCSEYPSGRGADHNAPVCPSEMKQHHALNVNEDISAKVKPSH
jgi:WD40 repeat protein